MRPENVRLPSEGEPSVVVSTSFRGSIRRTTARLEDGTLVVVQHDAGDRPQPGDRVRIALDAEPVPVEARPPSGA